jgi:hypothetical protein
MDLGYEIRDGKMITRSLEYSVAYHCNLRCAHCSHLSPYATRRFPPLESFVSDITTLGAVLHAKTLRLLGGEPLLHPQIADFAAAAKRSGIADRVMVTTNGVLLDRARDPFWDAVDLVLVTEYPGVCVEEQLTRATVRARAHAAELWRYPVNRFRTTIVTDPHPMDWITAAIYHACEDAHLFQCHMVYEGYLYKCAVPPFLPEYLTRLRKGGYVPQRDGLAIHRSRDLFQDLQAFLTSENVPESCRYCLGYLGVECDHRQLNPEQVDHPSSASVTRETHLDRDRLARTLFRLAGYASSR